MADEVVGVREFDRFAKMVDERIGGLSRTMHDGFQNNGQRLDAVNLTVLEATRALVEVSTQQKAMQTSLAQTNDRLEAVDAGATQTQRKLEEIDRFGCGAAARIHTSSDSPKDQPSMWEKVKPAATAAGRGASVVGGGAIAWEIFRLAREALAWLAGTGGPKGGVS